MMRDPVTNRPDSFDGIDKIFSASYFLTPGECNPEQRMPLTLLINRLIEVATLHANQVGIGWEYLKRDNQTWVLSRVAVEMRRYPGVNSNYRISTWITSINRLFSERNFEIADADTGEVIGYARTIWAVLDVTTRQAGDISRMTWVVDLIPDKDCPIAAPSRLRPVTSPANPTPANPTPANPTPVNPDGLLSEPAARASGSFRVAHYRFQYTDLDFNRHVNSSRYIELLMNQWSLPFHDANRLTRFEIAYIHEARYDEEATLSLLTTPIPDTERFETRAELLDPAGQPILRSLLQFSPR